MGTLHGEGLAKVDFDSYRGMVPRDCGCIRHHRNRNLAENKIKSDAGSADNPVALCLKYLSKVSDAVLQQYMELSDLGSLCFPWYVV